MTSEMAPDDIVDMYGTDPRTAFEPLLLSRDEIDLTLSAALRHPVPSIAAHRRTVEERTRTAAADLVAQHPEWCHALPFRDGDRIVVLGDSISAVAGGWADILGEVVRLVRPGVEFANRAVSGRTTVETIGSASAIRALEPNWIIVMIGTNDVRRHGTRADVRLTSPSELRELRRKLLRLLAEETAASVVVLTAPPIDGDGVEQNRGSGVWWTVDDISELATVTLELSPGAIDVHAEVVTGDGFWQPDGVHPTGRGQRAIAEIVLRGLGRYRK